LLILAIATKTFNTRLSFIITAVIDFSEIIRIEVLLPDQSSSPKGRIKEVKLERSTGDRQEVPTRLQERMKVKA
jgi:hypothetical protein